MATIAETPAELSLRVDDYSRPIGPRDPAEYERPDARYYFPFNRDNPRKRTSNVQRPVAPVVLT